MGLCEVLTLVFVVLKLTDKVAWSWWLVLLPEIIAFVFYIVLFSLEIAARAKIRKKYGKFSPRRW